MTGPLVQAHCLGGTAQLVKHKKKHACAHVTYVNMTAVFQQAPGEAAPILVIPRSRNPSML